MTVKTRVRGTSETVVDDVEVHHQRHRTHLVRKVGHQLDIPTMSTPAFSNVLRLGVMCGAEKVDVCFFVYLQLNKKRRKPTV